MSKKLILADVHLLLNRLRNVLKKHEEEYDETIFLGDYFDHFVEGYEGRCRTYDMASWLKDEIYDPRKTFLLGNHDIAYRIPGYYLGNVCGFTKEKNEIINKILTPEDWKQFKMFHIDKEFVLSHAGFRRDTFPFKRELLYSFDPATANPNHPWLNPGQDRGFYFQEFGGPLWLDWSRIQDIEGVRQIVGHTPGNFPKVTKNNVCLDTELNFAGSLDTSKKSNEFYTFTV